MSSLTDLGRLKPEIFEGVVNSWCPWKIQVLDVPFVKVQIGKNTRRRHDARSIVDLLKQINAPEGMPPSTSVVSSVFPSPIVVCDYSILTSCLLMFGIIFHRQRSLCGTSHAFPKRWKTGQLFLAPFIFFYAA